MKDKVHSDRSFEPYFPDLDTLLLVEDAEDKVIIRATRNTFSEHRKTRFIHHLAAEGFIPDDYQWVSGSEPKWSRVQWLVDASWLRMRNTQARTSKFMFRLLLGAAVLWLGLMAGVLFHWL